MSQLLTVVANLRARPGQETELRHQLQRLVTPTRAEAGCIAYELNESKSEPGHFLFYEVWKTEADLDEHFQTPHMKAVGKVLPELLAEAMELSKWSKL
jgi:quinol monooxygenase YgiN